jgi:hypothetical protein
MINNDLAILLALAKTTINELNDGVITSEEANRTFYEIKQKMEKIDKEKTSSIIDKLVTRIDF